MLTRNKLEEGEGELVSYNLENGRVWRKKKMEEEEIRIELEKYFHKTFYQMEDRVEKLFVDYP